MHSNLYIPHTLLFLRRLLIEWHSLLLNLFPQVQKGADSGPCLVPISSDQEKQEKSPSNARLSTLPTFSQPRIFSAAVYSVFPTLGVFFFFNFQLCHCGGYSFTWAFPEPPPSGSHPPPDRVTHPGGRSDSEGGLRWASALSQYSPPLPLCHRHSSPQSQGCSLGNSTNLDAAQSGTSPQLLSPQLSFTPKVRQLPAASSAALISPPGFSLPRLLLPFKSLNDTHVWS